MKFTYLQHIPHSSPPGDLAARRPEPVADTPYFGVAGPRLVHGDIRVALEEAMHAVRRFDAMAMTEHRRSSYDMDPNPDLAAAALAIRRGRDWSTGLHVSGQAWARRGSRCGWPKNWHGSITCRMDASSAASRSGSPTTPISTLVSRRSKRVDGTTRTSSSSCAPGPIPSRFRGTASTRNTCTVNIWPRPYQRPHPPVSVTGTWNPNTTRFALERDLGFNLVVLGGAPDAARSGSSMTCGGSPTTSESTTIHTAPAFAQYVVVGETDAEAERLYAKHVPRGTPRGIGHTPMHRLAQPAISFGELVDSGAIVAGSAATVRDRLADRARSYRAGNMLLSLQMGSMSTGLVNHSIDLFASGVMPHLRGIWSEYEDTNRWWPARLGGRPVAAVQPHPVAARLTWRRHSAC